MNGYFSKIISRSQQVSLNTGTPRGPAKKETIPDLEDFSQTDTEPIPAIASKKNTAIFHDELSPVAKADSDYIKNSGTEMDFPSVETHSQVIPNEQIPILNDLRNRPADTLPEKKQIAETNQAISPAIVPGFNERKPAVSEITSTIINDFRLPPENNTLHISNQKKETVNKWMQDKPTLVVPPAKKNTARLPVANINSGTHVSPVHIEKKQASPKLVIGKIIVEVIKPPVTPQKTNRQKNNRQTAPGMRYINISAGSKLSFGLGQL